MYCVDQCLVYFILLISDCSLGDDTAMLHGLHARLCHTLLAIIKNHNSKMMTYRLIERVCMSAKTS